MRPALDLDPVAESVYREMLAHPTEGIAALAERTGHSAEDVRDACDRLSELTLVRSSGEHDGQLRAIAPDLGMEVLIARQQAELAAQQARLEASRAAAVRLIAEHAELNRTQGLGMEQLNGLDAVRDRVALLSRSVREEVLTFAPDGAQTAANMEASRPLNREVLARDVVMRTVYLDSLRNNQATVDHANWLTSHGAQVRTVPALPTRMIIIDRSTAILPVSSADTASGAVILTGQGTLTALCALFEGVWATARPLGEIQVRDGNGLTSQESTTIRLLAQGHTDEAIAKRLGVSQRTARRVATDLMERLGARSRFEAGVRAVQRGWLPSRAD
ncbi:LuxR C-terminal-related transcriptional regulator [Streptomyces sp. NPDC015220]|uniref:LuxR C-terminal-related transcriptional regulator n=1 Tax=Streptomyces sp. NPDC015220 TaxID=3364947 RepID=UPI0036FDCE6C